MPTDFQEFLREKATGSDLRERNRIRKEWVESLKRLLDQIQNDLRADDPEGLLEFEPYEIRRAESRLGVYDAPALKIRLDLNEVTVLPIGYYSIGPLPLATRKAFQRISGIEGPLAGRVDITDGERKYMLFRDAANQSDRWFALADPGGSMERLFDRDCLEAILRDFWS